MSDEEMQELLAAVEQKLGHAWVDAVEWLRDQNGLDDVESRLRSGDIDGAVVGVEAAAKKFAAEVGDAYLIAGQRTAAWLDDLLSHTLVSFDTTNHRAVKWAQQNQLDLVRDVSQEQRSLMRDVISDGIREGQNPRETARDVRAALGLTSSQEDAVSSYRRALESGDYRNALQRELADGRSDRSLEAAIRDKRSIPQAQVDAMVERYRANYVAYRAQVISRTEAQRAINAGNQELFAQAIDNGDVAADALRRTWHSAHDARVRPSHRSMDGQSRGIDEPFETGDGVTMDYPGDPSAPVEEIAQCRCVVSTRMAS